MKVLVYTQKGRLRLTERNKVRIQRRVQEVGGNVVFVDDHKTALPEIVDAEVLFGYITPELLRHATHLKWIQAPMASFGGSSGEYYIFPELANSQVALTSMSGIYSDIISTHVFAYITCFARGFHLLFRNQLQRRWSYDFSPINLRNATLGILGLGEIGKAVARLGVAFGMRIIAVEPNPIDIPTYVESLWAPQDRIMLMREADFVVLCLPDAPGTVNIVGRSEIAAMKKTAYLINIGRGRTVDLEALIHALEADEIAGAGLDVFPPGLEPLPPDHPLWTMKNVILTPHCAGFKTPLVRRVDVFLENLNRYMQGKELLNLTDKQKMTRIGPGYQLPLDNP